MSTFTDKELIKEIKERISSLDVRDNVERRAYEIALASLKAKPIGAFHIAEQQVDGTSDYFKDGEWPIDNGIIEVYAAPPVPVVPEEMTNEKAYPLVQTSFSDAKYYALGWNACRAAILKGEIMINRTKLEHILEYARQQRHIGQHCKIPPGDMVEILEIAMRKTGNSQVIPGEVLSAIMKVARIRADFDDFDGDRRGIGDCLDEAEQELIVTINKYASQLAVEPVVPDDVLEQTVASPAPGNQVSELTMLVKRLASSLKSVNKSSKLPDKAMEYLNQNGLISAEDALR